MNTIKRFSLFHSAVLVVAAELLLVLYRLTLGVDYSDESFYVALPLRFALGDRPFVDDISLHQPPALLVTPFIWLWLQIVGSTFGLMLFTRSLYLGCTVAVASIVYHCLKREIHKANALFIAALVVLFVPYNIPNLSYNTIGMLLLTSGLFLFSFAEAGSWRAPAASGAVLGMTILCYPPFAPAVIFALASLALSRREKGFVMAFIAGLLVPLLFFGVWIFREGLMSYPHFVGLMQSYGEYGLSVSEKMRHVWYTFWHSRPPLVVLAAVLGVAAWFRRQSWVWGLFVPYFAWVAYADAYTFPFSANATIAYTFLFCLPWILILRSRDEVLAGARELATSPTWMLVATSLCAAVCAAWASTNGFLAACLGMFPALLVLFSHGLNGSRRFQARSAVIVLSLHMYLLGVFFLGDAFHREGKLESLTFRVANGPFAGLKTTPDMGMVLEDISKYYPAECAGAPRTLAYHPFVAGYLFTTRRPALGSVWAKPEGVTPFLLDRLENRTGAAVLRVFPFNSPNPSLDDFIDYKKAKRHNYGRFEILCM